jgi:hypothetical protein
MMKTHRKELAIAQEQWEEDAKNNRIEVTEDNVADVVSDDWHSSKSYCTNRK